MTNFFTRRFLQQDSILQIATPHLPLGQALESAIALLQRAGYELVSAEDDTQSFRTQDDEVGVTVHATGGKITSVVYDDPTGRNSEHGKAEKTRLYLARYGAPANWEWRMQNAWMDYWFNPMDKVAMVYGRDRDVLRFNRYEGE